ncbi:hypothetical protein BDR06DRAFT_1051801 [Suillus hirtellus]|nr:hypothetical protein BDR06DRAFT_1051801 [Suillus hirtellus]
MSVLCPPTAYLPPIAKIASFSVTQLLDALTYLQSLYHPEVRGSRRKPVQAPVSNGEQNLCLRHEDDSEPQAIRSDAFERSYSIWWLTTLIAPLEPPKPTLGGPIQETEEMFVQYCAINHNTKANGETLLSVPLRFLAQFGAYVLAKTTF